MDGDNITLTADSRSIAMYIVGDIAKDLSKKLGSFLNNFLVGDLDEDLDYQKLLSRNNSQ